MIQPDIHEKARNFALKNGYQGKISLSSITSGANNQVYKLKVGEDVFLLKSYFHHQLDTRDRLGSEYSFVSYAWAKSIKAVPRPFYADSANHYAVYEFVEGQRLNAGELTSEHIHQALDFFMQINHHRGDPTAKALADASEACFSLADHLAVLKRRIGRLQTIAGNDEVSLAAKNFVDKELFPYWQRFRQWVLNFSEQHDMPTDLQLASGQRCISPSDFGFHNALMQSCGNLKFIDFEYAGWDDPAKMVADFFCQPSVPVPEEYFDDFARAVSQEFTEPENFFLRLKILYPLCHLKWCCIILNEFLPVDANRRRFSNRSPDSDERKYKQLELAGVYLTQNKRRGELDGVC